MRVPTLVAAAAGSYVANVALGVATATRVIDTSGFRWLHHAIYITTASFTVAAVLTGARTNAGRRLVPALVPLAVIPYAGTHGRRHYVVAAAAAPFYALAALARS